jgi:putative transposase
MNQTFVTKFAAAFGLFYRLRSSEELNPLLVRNLVFLEDYLRDVPPVPEEVATHALALVAAFPGHSLAELRKHMSDGATSDQLFALIAAGRLYADPTEALLHRAAAGTPVLRPAERSCLPAGA